MRRQLIALLVALLVAAGVPAAALGDGDPGSDVLVYQSLFVASDAGLSIGQQVELTGVLRSAAQAGVPVRVAIIAHPDDDTPRLIFADWLEEKGDSARAEFIRVQIDRARLPE